MAAMTRALVAAGTYVACLAFAPAVGAESTPYARDGTANAVHDATLDTALHALAKRQVEAAASSDAPALRYDVTVGTLDARLRLAPCTRIEPLWPTGKRPWGTVQVALRCVDGPVRWKVYLPITVRAIGAAWVTRAPLPAGTVLDASHLERIEADHAATPAPPLVDRTALEGRALAHPVPAGRPLYAADLEQRRWFSVGDAVRVVTAGPGYRVVGEGVAMSPGLEGALGRVRVASGRILSGRPTGERELEVTP